MIRWYYLVWLSTTDLYARQMLPF